MASITEFVKEAEFVTLLEKFHVEFLVQIKHTFRNNIIYKLIASQTLWREPLKQDRNDSFSIPECSQLVNLQKYKHLRRTSRYSRR